MTKKKKLSCALLNLVVYFSSAKQSLLSQNKYPNLMSPEEYVPSFCTDDSQHFWTSIYERDSFPILAEVPRRPVVQEIIKLTST